MSVPKANIVGPRVRKARLASNLSQDALSARLARAGLLIDRSGISKIENGSRRVSDFEVKALTRILRVSAEWLLGG